MNFTGDTADSYMYRLLGRSPPFLDLSGKLRDFEFGMIGSKVCARNLYDSI